MKVYLNEITGYADAITSMFMSKRTWDRTLEEEIRHICNYVTDRRGYLNDISHDRPEWSYFTQWMGTLTKWGKKHITMLKFIDLSITVEGLHRGGQDDWDSHAKRFDNRIIRNSTRLANFCDNEKSDFYEGKILTTDEALTVLEIKTPDTIVKNGITYVKTVNGYIDERYKDDKDVKRGLYMLSIPSNFIFKVNLAEFAHVYQERNIDGTANAEVKELAEKIADELEKATNYYINRQLLLNIKN